MHSVKLEKSETIALLRHATAQSSTKEVAALIKVPDARVSEGKQGKWHLPRESADKLYEMFGRPLAAAGLYLKCEVWNSLEELQNEANNVSRWRQWRRISNLLRHNDFTNILSSLIQVDEHSLTTPPETVLKGVIHLVQDNDFCSWYRNNKLMIYREKENEGGGWQKKRGNTLPYFASSVSSDNGLEFPEILARHGLAPTLEWRLSPLPEPELTFLLLAEIALRREEVVEASGLGEENPYSLKGFLSEVPVNDKGIPKEVVVTGDIIWEKFNWLTAEKPMAAVLPFSGLPDITGKLQVVDEKYKRFYSVLPDSFNHLQMQVAITKSLDYNLILTLSQQRAPGLSEHMRENKLMSADINSMDFVEWIPPRTMVIRDVKSESLFDLINEVNAWLEIAPFPLDGLKREIAQNGGYVHGALYLE